jgi:hypothetical protein
LDCDSSPTKTEILHARRKNAGDLFWALSFGKRGAEELYDRNSDPDCITNLAATPELKPLKEGLKTQLEAELLAQEDPRMLGRGADFDAYPFANDNFKDFYNRFKAGAPPLKSFHKDDFETGTLDVPRTRE